MAVLRLRRDKEKSKGREKHVEKICAKQQVSAEYFRLSQFCAKHAGLDDENVGSVSSNHFHTASTSSSTRNRYWP
jgi:hypothetical protein